MPALATMGLNPLSRLIPAGDGIRTVVNVVRVSSTYGSEPKRTQDRDLGTVETYMGRGWGAHARDM